MTPKQKENLKRIQKLSSSPEARKKAAATFRATMAAKKQKVDTRAYLHTPAIRAKAEATRLANKLKGNSNGQFINGTKASGDIQEATTAARILGRIEGFIEGYAEARGLSRSRLRSWVAQRLAGEGERGEDF